MRDDLTDAARLALALIGLGLASYGAWLHYAPLGFLVGGVGLAAAAVVGALRAR